EMEHALKPRIDGLTFECQDAEHAFVNPPERLLAHEAPQRFHPKGKLADCERALPAERTLPKARQRLGAGGFRSGNDPQACSAATFHCRLCQIAAALLDEVQRFHDHALAARFGQRLPPRRRFGLARPVRKIYLSPRSCQKELRIRLAKTAESFHMPDVI